VWAEFLVPTKQGGGTGGEGPEGDVDEKPLKPFSTPPEIRGGQDDRDLSGGRGNSDKRTASTRKRSTTHWPTEHFRRILSQRHRTGKEGCGKASPPPPNQVRAEYAMKGRGGLARNNPKVRTGVDGGSGGGVKREIRRLSQATSSRPKSTSKGGTKTAPMRPKGLKHHNLKKLTGNPTLHHRTRKKNQQRVTSEENPPGTGQSSQGRRCGTGR